MHEDIFDTIDHELDDCENLECFYVTHSVAGGTGSGLGSRMFEDLADKYPKKLIHTISIFPTSENTSDTVVQPYNTILTLSRLEDFADSVMVIDNSALNKIAIENLRMDDPDFSQINKFVSSVMCSFSSPMRFPRHSYNSHTSLIAGLIPMHRLHYLISSFTPLGLQVNNFSTSSKKSNIYDIMRRLIKPQSMLSSIPNMKSSISSGSPEIKHCYISMLNILRGEIDCTQINRCVSNIRDQSLVEFVPWAPACIQTCISYKANSIKPKLQNGDENNDENKEPQSEINN
ncbi:MAG: Tubulin gamma-2 chain, partial [Paramarteilia canceri]